MPANIMRFKNLLYAMLLLPGVGYCFGADGHRIVGQIAYESLAPAVAAKVDRLLDGQPLAEACNWPDEVREQSGYELTGPLHYVNLPPRESQYVAKRDCRNDNCVVGAVERFYRDLADRQSGTVARAEALKFLCHFVGDLHQPLHTGYAHDRGGNDFDVSWSDGESNLHYVWDSVLVERSGSWELQVVELVGHCDAGVTAQIDDVLSWFDESRRLVLDHVYPAGRRLGAGYLQHHSETVRQRLCLAGCRLAGLIDRALR